MYVVITSCRGGPGPEAWIKFTPTNGHNLKKEKLYLFRIRIKANPMVTPNPNYWTIDFNGQSGEAAPGFTLWTFTNIVV